MTGAPYLQEVYFAHGQIIVPEYALDNIRMPSQYMPSRTSQQMNPQCRNNYIPTMDPPRYGRRKVTPNAIVGWTKVVCISGDKFRAFLRGMAAMPKPPKQLNIFLVKELFYFVTTINYFRGKFAKTAVIERATENKFAHKICPDRANKVKSDLAVIKKNISNLD